MFETEDQAPNANGTDHEPVDQTVPESPTGDVSDQGSDELAPAAGETGDSQVSRTDDGIQIGPVPYRRFQQVNERLHRAEQELQAFEQLRVHPAVRSALDQALSEQTKTDNGSTKTDSDQYGDLLHILNETEPETPIERAVKALLPGLVQENRELKADLQGVRQVTTQAEAERQARVVESAISDAAERYGLGDLDEDSKVSLVEEAYTIMLGAESAGRQLNLGEAFDRAARILQPETIAHRRREANRQVDQAKAGLSAGRPGGVRGPVNNASSGHLTRQEIFERNYRIAGGT